MRLRDDCRSIIQSVSEGSEELVILSGAKDHLATLDPRKKILRFAQDDTVATPLLDEGFSS